MTSVLERPDASQVITYAPDFTHPRYLGTIGHVQALHYSYACPGGCDQMSCTLQVGATERTDAMNPGRPVQVVRGASVIWAGKLDEPQPSPSGWQVTAHGSGTFGADFDALYSGNWPTGSSSSFADNVITGAISRGLQWQLGTTGISGLPGAWLGQAVDSGAQYITDFLNLVCTKGGLTWFVACRPSGNYLTVFPLPTAVTNLLVSNTPVARTLGGDINTIFIRYQTADDAADTPATYSTTMVQDANSVAAHGPIETYMDLSSAQVLSASAAQAVGDLVLDRYQRASFAGPFTVGPGQLLTTGGAPVDLGAGMPYAPMVCRLILTDYGYGGEVTPAPIQFLVGEYEFDDDTQTATVTPFQQLDTSFSSLLQMVVSTEPARQTATTSTKSVHHVHRGG